MDYTYEGAPENVQGHYKRITYCWNYALATACSYLDIPTPDWFKINVAYPISASLKSSLEQLGQVIKDKEIYKQTDDFRADVFVWIQGIS